MEMEKQTEPYVEHQVKPEAKEYLSKGRNFAHIPSSPYGSHYDFDPESWDPKTGEFKSQKKTELAIQGPANWSQAYTDWDSIGKDYQMIIPNDKPLPKEQLDYLKTSGEELENIEFSNILGEGAFGKVWSAIAIRKGRPLSLACKILRLIRNRNTSLEKTVNEMLMDMTAMRYLNHQNIVNFVDIIGIPDTKTGFPYAVICLFMELCDGDMDTILEAFPPLYVLPERIYIYWFRQIARGLEYLHQQNVVHLDIKPGNILFKYSEQTNVRSISENSFSQMSFKLADFGLSIAYKYDKPCISNLGHRGTPCYMAPELDNPLRMPVQTKPCDVFSLGITLADTLFGQSVITGYDIHDVMSEMRATYYPGRYIIGPTVVDLIYYMTHRNLRQRPTIGEVLEYLKSN